MEIVGTIFDFKFWFGLTEEDRLKLIDFKIFFRMSDDGKIERIKVKDYLNEKELKELLELPILDNALLAETMEKDIKKIVVSKKEDNVIYLNKKFNRKD